MANKRTVYQKEVIEVLCRMFNSRLPLYADFRADGCIKVKFYRRIERSVMEEITTWCRERGVELAPGLEMDRGGTYRKGVNYVNAVVPPSKDWVKPKRRSRSPHQKAVFRQIQTFLPEKVEQHTSFLDRFDESLHVFAKVDLNERSEDARLGACLDWCDENGVEYHDPNKEALPTHHNYWIMFTIPKEKQ